MCVWKSFVIFMSLSYRASLWGRRIFWRRLFLLSHFLICFLLQVLPRFMSMILININFNGSLNYQLLQMNLQPVHSFPSYGSSNCWLPRPRQGIFFWWIFVKHIAANPFLTCDILCRISTLVNPVRLQFLLLGYQQGFLYLIDNRSPSQLVSQTMGSFCSAYWRYILSIRFECLRSFWYLWFFSLEEDCRIFLFKTRSFCNHLVWRFSLSSPCCFSFFSFFFAGLIV